MPKCMDPKQCSVDGYLGNYLSLCLPQEDDKWYSGCRWELRAQWIDRFGITESLSKGAAGKKFVWDWSGSIHHSFSHIEASSQTQCYRLAGRHFSIFATQCAQNSIAMTPSSIHITPIWYNNHYYHSLHQTRIFSRPETLAWIKMHEYWESSTL